MEEWRTPERRNIMVSKIAEAMRAYPEVLNRNPNDIENRIYELAKGVEAEYNQTVAKVIVSIKHQGQRQQAAAAARYRPNIGFAGGPMDPQQQMVRPGLPQQQYYNTPRPLHPNIYSPQMMGSGHSYMPGIGPSPTEIMPQHSQPYANYMAGQPPNPGIGNIWMGGTMPYGQQVSEIQQRPPPYILAGGPQPGMGVEQSYSALPNMSFGQQDTANTNMFSKPPATSSPFVDGYQGPPSAVPVSHSPAPPPSGPALQHNSTPRKPSSMATSSPAISPEENYAYMRLIQDLQPYVPLLARLIEKLSHQQGDDEKKTEQYLKLNRIYSILTDRNERVSLQTLVKCEKALEKLFEKQIDGQQTASTPLPHSSASDPPQIDDAETDFAVVKEHIKQQGSVDVLSLKSYLIGPSRVGKTTTLRRLTGKINHLSPDEIVPSTGIEAPLTVQLYTHQVEQSSVLVSEGWQIQELSEQCQSLFSHIRNSAISSSSKNCISEQIESSTVKPTESADTESADTESADTESADTESADTESADTVSSFPTQSKPVVQDDIISQFTLPIDVENTRLKLKNLKDFTLVHFIDIGGQPEFHEILPLLLHGLALNMLFFDLTQNLDSPYTVVYRAEDTSSSPIQYDCEFTIREIIQRALHSISSLQSSTTNYSKPAAILVGTHCDKCDRKNIPALEQSVQNTFANFIEDCVLCPVSGPGESNKYIHLLDNVSEDCSDVKDLQKLISTVVHDRFKSEPVPISALLLHLILRMKFDPTPGWCSLEECIEIAERCGISREDLTKKGGILQYLHDRFGTILHYRGLKIGQKVIVNPNIIMRPPVELFVTAFGAKTSEQATAEKIRRTGEIPHRLMEKICSTNKGQSTGSEIPTDEIVELLNSRYILYENAQSANEENVYFLPCLLYPDHKIDAEFKNPCHLSSLTYPSILLIPRVGYVPLGPFPATIVKLSQSSNWTLAKRPRFRNRIRFYFLPPSEQVLDVELCALSTHLEFRIRHDTSCKPINPRLIQDCLLELTKCFDDVLSFYPHTKGLKWDFGFYCPHAIQSGQCPHPASCMTKDKPQEVICSQEGCRDGPVYLDDKHACWFTKIVNPVIIGTTAEPSCKYTDPPTVKMLVKAATSVSDWSILGLYLGLEPAELKDIHTTHHAQGVNTLKMMMFDKWLKKRPEASWDNMIEALTDMGEVTAADQVRTCRAQKPSGTCNDEAPPTKKRKQDQLTP